MIRKVRSSRGLILLVLLFFLTGCWNRREIETLGFVLAVGLDKAPEEGKIMVTVHIAKPFAIAGPSVVDERPFWIISSSGYTVFEAVRNLLALSPRQPFWAHTRSLVVGEELAREGIGSILDFFFRDGETRADVHVVIAKGNKASELLEAEWEQTRMPSEGALGIMRNSWARLGTTVDTELLDFIEMLEMPGVEPVAVREDLLDLPPEGENLVGELRREAISKSARISGAAVFNGDRLVGWLGPKQTRGLNWIRGKVRGTVLVFEQPNLPGQQMTVEVLRASSKIKPMVTDGRPHVIVEIFAEGNLGELQGYTDPISQTELWASFERRFAEVIRNEAESAIDAAKELKADIFGFGTAFYRNMCCQWERMEDNWPEIFSELDVYIDVRADLRRSGQVARRFLGI